MLGRREKTVLERSLGYRFRDPDLLEMALTHRSYANEQSLGYHNERLEFLGDAVLGLIAAQWLYAEHPELPEGDLSKLKAYLVSAPALAGSGSARRRSPVAKKVPPDFQGCLLWSRQIEFGWS